MKKNGLHTCTIEVREKVNDRVIKFNYLSSGENEKLVRNNAQKTVEELLRQKQEGRKIVGTPRIVQR